MSPLTKSCWSDSSTEANSSCCNESKAFAIEMILICSMAKYSTDGKINIFKNKKQLRENNKKARK